MTDFIVQGSSWISNGFIDIFHNFNIRDQASGTDGGTDTNSDVTIRDLRGSLPSNISSVASDSSTNTQNMLDNRLNSSGSIRTEPGVSNNYQSVIGQNRFRVYDHFINYVCGIHPLYIIAPLILGFFYFK